MLDIFTVFMMDMSRTVFINKFVNTSKTSQLILVLVNRSPDSALQSGLESKPKFTPSGPMLWKGFISMQDFAKFFTSAYKVSGPVENLVNFARFYVINFFF